MTTPAVVYRHRAMRSLRAMATIVVLRIRPPRRRTRSWNHRLSAEVGWFRSHSQASSTIVVLSRGLPALDTPCCHRSCDSPRLWALKIPWLAFPPTIQPGRAPAEWLSRHWCHPPLGGGGADGPTWRTDDDPGTASTRAVGHRDRAADGP